MEDQMDKYVGIKGAAEIAEITAKAFRSYVARGYAPPPSLKLEGKPLWLREDLETWMDNRPGQGNRTDLKPPTEDVDSVKKSM